MVSNALIQQYEKTLEEESKKTLIEEWMNEAHYNQQGFEQLIEFATYYEQLGHIELALMIYLRLQTIEPQTKLIELIAKAYAHIYEYDKAIEWMQLIPEQQMNEKMRFQVSQWLIKDNQTEKAKDILTQLVKEFPTFAEPYFSLADYYETQGDLQRALTFVEAVYEYFLDEKDRNLARQKIVALKLNQEQIPLAELEDLMTEDELPLTEANDYYLLAHIYRLSQKYDLAQEAVKKSLKIEPNNPTAIDLLVELEKFNQSDYHNELIDWFQENIPESHLSPIELASLESIDERTFNEGFIQRLIGYLAYTVDLEEQYQIIRAVLQHFLSKKDLESFDHFLNDHALNYLSEDELSYFIGKKAWVQKAYDDAINYLEIARDYLIPENDLIELLVKSYETVNDFEQAEALAREYQDTEYQTSYLKRMIRRHES